MCLSTEGILATFTLTAKIYYNLINQILKMRQFYPKLLAGLVFLSMSLMGGVYAQAPVNDDVCNAIDLTTYDTLYVFDNFNTTVEPGEADIVPSSTEGLSNVGWFEQGLTSTVWFTFTAPAAGAVRIDL